MTRLLLPALLAFAVLLRLAAWLALSPELESDGLAYVTMARSLAETGVMQDNFGQHVFYSAGYPLLLAPFFALLGAGLGTVMLVNALLALVTGLLVHRLVRALGGSEGAALAALALWAVWLPSVWNAAFVSKENLSTPLLLGLLLAALHLAQRGPLWRAALAGGLCWGAGVVTGGSSVLAGAALALGLWLGAPRLSAMLRPAMAAGLAAALVLAPWLIASQRMVGEPMLNSNAEFNLYLGNNPAATGGFVSIAETPAGPQWNAMRAALGEAGSAHWLGDQARGWIKANPEQAARLAAIKLARFWLPNVPDAADFAASKGLSLVRLGEVACYLLTLLLAVAALATRTITGRERAVVAVLIAGFWAVHAAAYVMPRYRDPLAPVLVALAACWLWPRLTALYQRRRSHAA